MSEVVRSTDGALEVAPGHGWREPLRRFLRHQPLGVAGAAIVLVMIGAAVLAGVVAPYDYLETDYAQMMVAPSWTCSCLSL